MARISIPSVIWRSGSGKTNALLNRINHEVDIDKICLYAKDLYETKYRLLINRRESTGLKYLNDPKAFIDYWNDTDGIYENIKEYKIKNEKYLLYLMISLLICLIIKNLLRKFQTTENFNKFHLIIHQMLTFKTLWIFIKTVLKSHILFWLLILLLHQIIFIVSERIF